LRVRGALSKVEALCDKIGAQIAGGYALHIFIDESGSFSGYHDQSLSVVGALAIPNGKLDFIKRKYAKIRARLRLENGEVKGRLLNEQQVNEVVTMLARNDVLFELTAVDLGFHTESDVAAYKQSTRKGCSRVWIAFESLTAS